MKIQGGNNNNPLRPDRARDARAVQSETAGNGGQPTPAQVEKLDRVEISAAGRAKAAGRLEPVAPDAANRLAEIRQRVLSGAYDADAVVGDVAQRILDRGDV
jgi:Anti-sigma-28 factor, FlgM